MLNLFISYGRADSRELAIRLRDDLRAMGYSVWLDLEEIPGGASWSENIEQAIEHCHVALSLMSSAAFHSQWCRAEVLRAIRKGKRVVPIMVHEGAEIPLHLEHLNYLDFSNLERYDEMFRDLLSDINAGQAFQSKEAGIQPTGKSPFKKTRQPRKNRSYKDEKRNAPAFRRHLAELRREDWLGARYWWPYFLFYFTDMQQLVDVLAAGELLSPFEQGGDFNSRWDKYVRLYLRPRTPDLWRAEGLRPAESINGPYCPLPVYLLFDMESVICHPDSRFSDGDPKKIGKTYKTPAYFRELPFEQIYHDSWFLPDERDEIMRHREAQVVIPERLGLEGLQLIWVRSDAEYETLRSLLPANVWKRWRDKITPRTDYHLFNRKWVYVQSAALSAEQAIFRFNLPERERDCGPFALRVEVELADGTVQFYEDERFAVQKDLAVTIQGGDAGYTIRCIFDGDVAYMGQHQPHNRIV